MCCAPVLLLHVGDDLKSQTANRDELRQGVLNYLYETTYDAFYAALEVTHSTLRIKRYSQVSNKREKRTRAATRCWCLLPPVKAFFASSQAGAS